MTPNNKHSITVGIGVAPKGRSILPSGKNPFESMLKSANSATGGSGVTGDDMSGQTDDGLGGGKASRDDAGFIAKGEWCGSCQNYTRESKECSKVDGSFNASDACREYYEPVPGHEGGDAGGGLDAALAGGGEHDTESDKSLSSIL